MLNKQLKLSIVIPVYNEQNYLSRCLDAIVNQTIAPLEVVIVDNNCTDKSMDIAKKYDFVKIISEPRQHQSYAQKTGFDNAAGDIIGRIDADTILPENWSENVLAYFSEHPKTVAITGTTEPYDVYFRQTTKKFMNFYHKFVPKMITGHYMLWGSNAAIKRSAWNKISSQVLQRADIWEDYDISFLLAKLGNVDRLDNLIVRASFRSAHKPILWLIPYQFRAARTFWHRAKLWQTLLYTLIHSTLFITFVPGHFIEKSMPKRWHKNN